MHNSHKTAITRKKPSVPLRELLKRNLVKDTVLDYGCGRGFDADYLGCDRYDKHYQPFFPNKRYDTILCTYVLNVLFPKDVQSVLSKIKMLLKSSGNAYITVRRDIKRNNNPNESVQRYVELDLPTIKECSTYCIYKLTGS